MTGRTTTRVHSAGQMQDQRWHALAFDRCALGGISVYTQIYIGLALYMYSHVSTPGYISILLTIPFALLMLFLAFETAKNTDPNTGVIPFSAGKHFEKPVLFVFLLLHLFNAQLVFTSLGAMLLEVMPEHSLWQLALLITLSLAWANSGRKEDALARLARFLKWVVFLLLLYVALTSMPHGSAAHFFPLLGYGWKTIGSGAVWMCGAVSGCVWPLIRPQDRKSLSPMLERKSRVILIVLLSILAGSAAMAVSVWLMPFFAMAASETMGWRLMPMTHMTPSIPAWSMETVGVLLLFYLALSYNVAQASALLSQIAGRLAASGWMTLLLLLLLMPCAALQYGGILETLSRIAFLRGPVTLILVLMLYLGSVYFRKRKDTSK
ncbi:MAG: hypothetical protein IK099_15120 [Clostridia bacterium]|nr:hypothetical protein [Clostridia bacterium]